MIGKGSPRADALSTQQNTLPDALRKGAFVLGAGTRTDLKLRLVSDCLAAFAGLALASNIGIFRATA